jgi:hypothetical protein
VGDGVPAEIGGIRQNQLSLSFVPSSSQPKKRPKPANGYQPKSATRRIGIGLISKPFSRMEQKYSVYSKPLQELPDERQQISHQKLKRLRAHSFTPVKCAECIDA